MSLLLALTGGAGPPPVNCTVVMSQVQNISGTFGLTRDTTGLVSQVQSSSGTFGRVLGGTVSTSQVQSISGLLGFGTVISGFWMLNKRRRRL